MAADQPNTPSTPPPNTPSNALAADAAPTSTVPMAARGLPSPEERQREEENRRKRRRNLLIGGMVAAIVLVGALGWWLYSRTYEDTDDAQVDGHLDGVTSRIDGVVKAVYVEEDQTVKAGQLLVDIDPKDYQVALEQAQADLLRAEANLQATQPNVPITQTSTETTIITSGADVINARAAVAGAEKDYAAAVSRLHEAEANNAKAQTDVQRYELLAEKQEVSREQYDQVVATAKALAALEDSARESADAAEQGVNERKAQLDQANSREAEARTTAPHQIAISHANQQSRQADVQAMQAAVDQAQLDLSYCRILSPANGVVANRTAEPGEQISKGQRLLTVSDLSDLWVTANFKETQLQKMRTGQSATISVDALDQKFDGYVEDMPGATGAVTSLLPPENATGNYVKVVQRLPVRIRLKPGQAGMERLRPGMSVEPKVWIR